MEPKMFDPDWIATFIIGPINDFAFNYVSDKTIMTGKYINTYYSKNDPMTRQIKESIMHTLVDDFLTIMLKHKDKPGLVRGGVHGQDIINFLNKNLNNEPE
jgi:hypothetical protein